MGEDVNDNDDKDEDVKAVAQVADKLDAAHEWTLQMHSGTA